MSRTKPSPVSISKTEPPDGLQPWERRDREIMAALHREIHDRELIRKKNMALAETIQSWINDEESADEQRETLECLMKALDEDRLSSRKLFP